MADSPPRARGLPHNWETERAVLGGLLLDCSQADEIAAIVRAEDFSKPQNAALLRVYQGIMARAGRCDLTALLDEIGGSGDFDAYGGAAYVVSLPQACATVDHLAHHARRVRETADRRRLIVALSAELERVAEPSPRDVPGPTAADLCDRATAAIQAVRDGVARDASWTTTAPVVDELAEQVRKAAASPGTLRGLSTGFHDLDRILGGLEATRLYVLAARPGMGKTSLALCVAANVARMGQRVGVFSLEMGRDQLVAQMVAQRGKVEARRMLEGRGGPDDIRRWQEGSDEVAALPILIDDTAGLSIAEIRARSRAMQREGGLGLVVVDYLQLASAPDVRRHGREVEVSAIARGCKGLAKDLGVPVLALSQLNRKCEERADKRPMPSDLRESGAIEQDADALLFLYRDEVYNPQSPDKGLAEVGVPKNRGGATGSVKLAFLPHLTLFQNYAGSSGEPDRGSYY